MRTKAMMHKIDTDGEGKISHDEYIGDQVKIFDMMDTSQAHTGMVGRKGCLQRAAPTPLRATKRRFCNGAR